MNNQFFIILAFIFLVACADQSIQKFQKKAQIEQEGSNRAENENLKNKAIAMEADLQQRYRYYSSLSARYRGQFAIQDNHYQAQLILSTSFHVTPTERIRNLEEIQEDLNNLYLNAQFSIWDKEENFGSSGCTYERIKLNMNTGQIELLSSNCPTQISIVLTLPETQSLDRLSQSQIIAKELLRGLRSEVPQLFAQVNSIYNSQGYQILFHRNTESLKK